MYPGLLITVAVLIILCAILISRAQENTYTQKIINIEAYNEMEELFFEELRNNEKTYKLTHVLNEYDFLFIKEIFLEERIPYHRESDNSLNLWPTRKIGIFGNINLYILEKNHDDVMKIIDEYKSGFTGIYRV